MLVAAAEGEPSRGGGSGEWGAESLSVPEARYDEERAGAVGVGTDLNVVAVTGAEGRAEESALDWLKTWKEPGPGDGGVGMAAEDSWDHCVGRGNHQGQGAVVAEAASGEGLAGAKLGMLVYHPALAVDTVAVEGHPLDPGVAG